MLLGIKLLLDVTDMERAVTFYTSTFGLDVAVQSPDWSELRFGDATVALHGGREATETTSTGLSFTVDDVEAVASAVKANGGTIVQGPFEPGGEGIRLAAFIDPEGNHFMASQRLG